MQRIPNKITRGMLDAGVDIAPEQFDNIVMENRFLKRRVDALDDILYNLVFALDRFLRWPENPFYGATKATKNKFIDALIETTGMEKKEMVELFGRLVDKYEKHRED